MEYIVSETTKKVLTAVLLEPAVCGALTEIEKDQKHSIEETVELVKVEAPTFHEENRAVLLARKFEECGLEEVRIDRGGNVSGLYRGLSDGPKVLVEGHMDTVFPFGSVHEVRRENNHLYAPGIGDDTRALAMILSMIRAMKAAGVHAFPQKASIKINFRSNSQEELERLDGQIFTAVEEACKEESDRWGHGPITWDRKIFCDVPAGRQDPHAPRQQKPHSGGELPRPECLQSRPGGLPRHDDGRRHGEYSCDPLNKKEHRLKSSSLSNRCIRVHHQGLEPWTP